MNALRRTLYVQAAVWAVSGVALAAAPRLVVATLFGSPAGSLAWLRLLGIQTLALAMVMVLVGHRVEETWWWAWAFALAAVPLAAVVVLHTAFRLGPHESAAWWWTFAAVSLALAFSLLYGLFVASRERPL